MKKIIIYFDDDMEKGVKAQIGNLFVTDIIKGWSLREYKEKLEDWTGD